MPVDNTFNILQSKFRQAKLDLNSKPNGAKVKFNNLVFRQLNGKIYGHINKDTKGKGNFGKVYKVYDENGKPHALKVAARLPKPGSQHHNQEARVLEQLGRLGGRGEKQRDPGKRKLPMPGQEPNHLKATDVKEFIVQPWYEGKNLQDFLTQNPSAETRSKIGRDLVAELQFIHSKGLVHRDLKPDNVMVELGDNGEYKGVKIIDVGLAEQVRDASGRAKFDQPVGTPPYSAPEVVNAMKQGPHGRGLQLNQKTDNYSLGLMLKELGYGDDVTRGLFKNNPNERQSLSSLNLNNISPKSLGPAAPLVQEQKDANGRHSGPPIISRNHPNRASLNELFRQPMPGQGGPGMGMPGRGGPGMRMRGLGGHGMGMRGQGGPGMGMPGAPGFGMPHGQGLGMPHGPGFGMPHGPGFGMPHGPGFGMPHGPGFGMPHGPGLGMPHGPGFGIPHGPGFGMPHGPGFGMARGPGLGGLGFGMPIGLPGHGFSANIHQGHFNAGFKPRGQHSFNQALHGALGAGQHNKPQLPQWPGGRANRVCNGQSPHCTARRFPSPFTR